MGSFEQAEFSTVATDRVRRRARITGELDRAAKRAADVLLSLVMLIVLAPVLLACGLAVCLESRGPIFYRATRVGRAGRQLHVVKFRKMVDGAGGLALTGVADDRFTRIGRFLARTKLDELPQLWNVLRGDMSLVGPRPEDSEFVAMHGDDYHEILSVRPGITGLCQLAFARETEILDPEDRRGHYVRRILPQKVALDVLYARSRTFGGDLKILAWTILPLILRRDVAVRREDGVLSLRRRS